MHRVRVGPTVESSDWITSTAGSGGQFPGRLLPLLLFEKFFFFLLPIELWACTGQESESKQTVPYCKDVSAKAALKSLSSGKRPGSP